MEDRLTFTIAAPAPSATNKKVARRQRRAIEDAVQTWQAVLTRLDPDELEALTSHIQRTLATTADTPTDARRPTGRGRPAASEQERLSHGYTVLLRSFLRRRELLADALTTQQVAALLGTSRQTPHDRVANNTLLAVHDRGVLRFPAWQFDPNGPDGVIDGLPQILQALRVSPLAKVSWLVRPNPYLDQRRPLDVLKDGGIVSVLRLAQSVGIS